MTKTIDQIIKDATAGITDADRAKSGTYTLTNGEAAIVSASLATILSIHHGQLDEAEITLKLLAIPEAHNTIADVLGRIVDQQAPESLKDLSEKIRAKYYN